MSASVYLVGAGPGDPGLVTLRARELIARCDVLVYDRLVNPELQTWVKTGCELIYVGKDPLLHAIPQDDIEDLIVARAKAGKIVVRLKGGDPFIFGRGGEEAQRLARDGVLFEIVPGVTAALAAASYAGIPLTHRDFASSLCFITGHENPEKHEFRVDFKKFANLGGTLCLYMAMGQLERIVGELSAGGLAANTPAAVVQWATTAQQKTLFTTLGELVAAVAQAGLGAPAVIIIGEAVKAANGIGWFEARPLFGRRIVVPRAREQAGELRQKFEELGAEVLELPLIEIKTVLDVKVADEVFSELATYDWGVFTSPNGAKYFLEEVMRRCKDVRALGPMKFACLGPATAREVEKFSLEVTVLPKTSTSTALGRRLDCAGLTRTSAHPGRYRQSQPRGIADPSRERSAGHCGLPASLSHGFNRFVETRRGGKFRALGADAIAFTSASTVESIVQQAKHLVLGRRGAPPLVLRHRPAHGRRPARA